MSDGEQEPPDEYNWLFNNRELKWKSPTTGQNKQNKQTNKQNKTKKQQQQKPLQRPRMQKFKHGRK